MITKICGAFSNRKEYEGFDINKPDGEGVYVFLHFYDPVKIIIDNEELITKQNACIIFTTDFPQEYYAIKGGFSNDYVKFMLSDKKYIYEKNLPFNEIFYIKYNDEIRRKTDRITWALTDVMNDHSSYMITALDEILDLVSSSRIFLTPKSKRENEAAIRLAELRNEIKNNPSGWTVEKMSEAFFLTRSHFSTLYTKQFGISPRDDLLNFRMDYAKNLLLTTDTEISVISEMCGYINCENFIRVFRKQTGTTPLQYRKNHSVR